MPILTLLLIVWAMHPENRIQSTVMNKANLVRLQWKTFMLADPVSNPAIEKLLLTRITFTDFDVTLALYNVENSH